MSVLSDAMRLSIAVSAGTQLLPGTRVSFKDREDPKPLKERLRGTVHGLSLYFDGERLALDAVAVHLDGDHAADISELFQVEELDQLEILP